MRKLQLEELKRDSVQEFKSKNKFPFVLLLDNVRSLNNVGSAFRTADAFAFEKLALTGITGTPPHREIEKTAIGATESVDWEYFKDARKYISVLKSTGYEILAVEQTDRSILLQDFKINSGKKYCLVFGNEVFGISEEILEQCDSSIEIPQFGTKHSINVSVAVGIVSWHFLSNHI
jgi:tRNA G18 (ribose-2'-O)-methylase SpoU